MIDWDDAFDNSGYVPGSDTFAPAWAEKALTFRTECGDRARIDVPYGTHPREMLDVFSPKGAPLGTAIFIHGGYWHLLDKSFFSHLAAGCVAQGWQVVIPSYPLAPDARISTITKSIGAAVAWTAANTAGPLALIGHSAGGHLVARMMCDGVLPPATIDRLKRSISVSGVHQLEPLLETQMNETLHLTKEEARAESPILQDPVRTVGITFWVGANERPEFLRQNRAIAETWGLKGAAITTRYEADQDHFSVIMSLADSDGALVKELLS